MHCASVTDSVTPHLVTSSDGSSTTRHGHVLTGPPPNPSRPQQPLLLPPLGLLLLLCIPLMLLLLLLALLLLSVSLSLLLLLLLLSDLNCLCRACVLLRTRTLQRLKTCPVAVIFHTVPLWATLPSHQSSPGAPETASRLSARTVAGLVSICCTAWTDVCLTTSAGVTCFCCVITRQHGHWAINLPVRSVLGVATRRARPRSFQCAGPVSPSRFPASFVRREPVSGSQWEH